MLQIKELVIKNDQQDLILVDGLSFTLNENDKIAVIGSEGSGKSTFLSVLKGDSLPHVTVTGEIIRTGVIAYLEQNIALKWGDYTVDEYLTNDQELHKRMGEFGFHYKDIRYRQIKTFSGGEKVKIGLIKSLSSNPDVLLLDEPSNDLDLETLLFLERFLIDISIPILFVSHDQRLLERVSNGIIHLQHIHKKTKAKSYFIRMDYQSYKEQYMTSYVSSMMIARKQRSEYKQKMERFRQIYEKVAYQQNQAVRNPGLGASLKRKIKNLKSQERRYEKEAATFVEIPEKEESMQLFFEQTTRINAQKQLLHLDIKAFKLKNNKNIDTINLSLKATDKIVIMGPNGVGKTTLLKHIENKLKADGIKVGYLSQNYNDILSPDLDIVTFLLKHQEKYEATKLRQILGVLGLKKAEMTYPIKDLSEGTKLKVLLLLLVSKEVDMLLLDEPTRNLSPINQDELYELFLNFKGAIIAISHDRAFIEMVFDDVYELSNQGLTKLQFKE